ncbi:MAG: hypothetical protein PF508_02715 [Spirochaeta sp.]|nr:hypothetical protein [Spirochaeta sp.]
MLSAIQEDAGYPAIAAVEIANPFNLQDTADGKLSVVDVLAQRCPEANAPTPARHGAALSGAPPVQPT